MANDFDAKSLRADELLVALKMIALHLESIDKTLTDIRNKFDRK
jgi:hypothetical protein